MRPFAIAVTVLALMGSGCRGKHNDLPGKKNTETGPVSVNEPKLDRDVPEMGAIYKDAYEEAKREITKDNVEDKLDDLEHDVNKGM